MFEILKKIPLLNNLDTLYTGAIYKNGTFKLLNTYHKEINYLDTNLEKRVKINLFDQYSFFCSFEDERTYLSIKRDDYKHLYILDEYFHEIDRITLNVPICFQEKIVGVAYDDNHCKILVITSNKFYSIDKKGYFLKNELSKNILNHFTDKKKELIKVRNLNGCYQNMIHPKIIYDLTSISFINNKIFMAYKKNHYSYISEISCGKITKTCFIDENILIHTIFKKDNYMHLLVTKSGMYNYFYMCNGDL